MTQTQKNKREDVPQLLGDRVFENILGMISDGRLEAGSAVNEKTLAEELGVSRGPVREAVRRLQGIQLVSREPYLKSRVVSLNKHAMIGLFEMREALEGMASRLAAERMAQEDIDSLSADMQAARDKGEEAGFNFDFHERIVSASGNDRIRQALAGDLYYLLRLFRRQSDATGRNTVAYEEHWQILRAIENRDPDLSESLMRMHIRRAKSAISELGELD